MNELIAYQKPNRALIEIEKSRAVQETQASLLIAKKMPRDMNQAYTRTIESCKRLGLAKSAMYSYPRGGQVITGPSIRLAEVLAQNYGNLDFGVKELERLENSSIVESYCWDLESNTKQNKMFEVPHEIELKSGVKKKLTSERDIYEYVANMGARRLRACILGIIPPDFIEGAIEQIKATIAKGDGKPIADRIRQLILMFKDLGVSQEMIETRMNHKIDLTTIDEIVELSGIYNSLKDKQASRADFFNFKDEADSSKAKDLIAKIADLKKDEIPKENNIATELASKDLDKEPSKEPLNALQARVNVKKDIKPNAALGISILKCGENFSGKTIDYFRKSVLEDQLKFLKENTKDFPPIFVMKDIANLKGYLGVE